MIETAELEFKKIDTLYLMWKDLSNAVGQFASLVKRTDEDPVQENWRTMLVDKWLHAVYFPVQEALLKKLTT